MKLDICVHGDAEFVCVHEHHSRGEYLPDGSTLTAKNRFEYKDTASVDILRLNSTDGENYSSAVITLRTEAEPAKIKLSRDGWFTAIHIVIPTKEWVYRELDKQGSIIYTYDRVYFTDGSKIFTCTNGVVKNSSLRALVEELSDNTTISRVEADYVSIRLLNDQLEEAYMALFKNRMYNGGCHTDACAANRLVTAINLIRHYVRHGSLAEAERIIEKVNHFNTQKSNNKKKDIHRYNDCGCQ